jgi:predicted rRNA methylase YqxC with S4 and FtsJ domains
VAARAPQVFGVDVGFGQVVGSISQEPRVTVMERTNLRHLQPGDLPCKVRAAALRAASTNVPRVPLNLECTLTPTPSPCRSTS